MELNKEELKNDIPLSQAISAFRLMSHSPEKRGEATRGDYAQEILTVYEALFPLVAGDATKAEALEDEMGRFRERYKAIYSLYLARMSRCASPMITGPANFHTQRNEKAFRAVDRSVSALKDCRGKTLRRVRRLLVGGGDNGPIMAGDKDAVERLEAKIRTAEEKQERMKVANKIIRDKKKPREEKRVAIDTLGLDGEVVLTPDCMGAIGFPSYALTNNNANIRRMRERLARLKQDKQKPSVGTENKETGLRYQDSPQDNRVRLFFPGKPSAEVRTGLKRHGFRWAPSLGCWQAYRNERSTAYAWGVFKEAKGCQ